MRAYLGIDVGYVDVNLKNNFDVLEKVKSQHLTLYFWNDLSENEAERISKKLKYFQNKSFVVEATEVYGFPNKTNPHLVALKFNSLDKLVELRKDVLSYLNLVGDLNFEPHITLYRKKKLDSSFKESKEFLEIIGGVKVKISNVSLYSSNPDKGLNEYKLIQKKILS
ncbi:RNA 2',3'-cyclic phosphodiesterase [archaeon]|jgi:2'-5' RNA ligase|nr:RNA 2',3'-cyclic phosphodiesterase [archaeon]